MTIYTKSNTNFVTQNYLKSCYVKILRFLRVIWQIDHFKFIALTWHDSQVHSTVVRPYSHLYIHNPIQILWHRIFWKFVTQKISKFHKLNPQIDHFKFIATIQDNFHAYLAVVEVQSWQYTHNPIQISWHRTFWKFVT